jgi:hypothetical protein
MYYIVLIQTLFSSINIKFLVVQSFVFCVVFCRSFCFFWPLYCLSLFDLSLLLTSLVSSNFSLLYLNIFNSTLLLDVNVSPKNVNTTSYNKYLFLRGDTVRMFTSLINNNYIIFVLCIISPIDSSYTYLFTMLPVQLRI